MAVKKRTKRKKSASQAVQRRLERRFMPEQTQGSRAAVGIGMAGSLMLGVGVYGHWLTEQPPSYAIYLVAVGAIGLVYALVLNSRTPDPIRVGDAGVGFEKGDDVLRYPWYRLQQIRMDGARLQLKTDQETLYIAVASQPKAVAKIVQEAAKRISERLELSPSQADTLPKLTDADGEVLRIEGAQVAGEKCAASGTLISFERDARICPACGQIYHKDHVPNECVSCGGSVGGKAIAVA